MDLYKSIININKINIKTIYDPKKEEINTKIYDRILNILTIYINSKSGFMEKYNSPIPLYLLLTNINKIFPKREKEYIFTEEMIN